MTLNRIRAICAASPPNSSLEPKQTEQNARQGVKQSRHRVIAPGKKNSYNINLLGISLAVGRLILDQLGQVRILDPQPVKVIKSPQTIF